MLGKAYFGALQARLGQGVQIMGNQSSGNEAMQRQTPRCAHSTLRSCGSVRARARDISFHGCSTADQNALESFHRAARRPQPLSAYLYRSQLDCLVTALETLDTRPAERSPVERLWRRQQRQQQCCAKHLDAGRATGTGTRRSRTQQQYCHRWLQLVQLPAQPDRPVATGTQWLDRQRRPGPFQLSQSQQYGGARTGAGQARLYRRHTGRRLASGYVVTSLQGEVIAGAGNTSGFTWPKSWSRPSITASSFSSRSSGKAARVRLSVVPATRISPPTWPATATMAPGWRRDRSSPILQRAAESGCQFLQR